MDIIRVVEVLAFYDFPQLFIGLGENSKYLCLSYSVDNCLCIEVNEEDMQRFKNNEVDLLTLYFEALNYYTGDWKDTNLIIISKLVGSVDKDMLPDPGFYYKGGD